MKALSIRQPHAEQILCGKKNIEYRTSLRTSESVFTSMQARRLLTKMPGMRSGSSRMTFQPGVIVGTVEVVGCRKVRGEYEWDLAEPVRLERPLKPKNQPQPAWFYPFGK